MPRSRDEILIAAFGAVLREERAARGMTQEALAQEAEVHPVYIGLLETAKRQPSLSVIFSLAQALGMTPGALLDRTNAHVKR
jgi:transcriptional regulator with XRE-family HTH domain